MKAKCYYCNKELTERTIKRHMKNCDTMKKKISEEFEENKSKRKQYIISIKYKYCKDYCIYISIDAALQLCHLDQFIRDVWVECCGHLSEFIIDGTRYLDNSDGNYQMNVRLKDVFYTGLKFDYEYDFGSTTYLTLEVIDEIAVSKKHSQIEIIARNNEEGRPNSPREGECGYICDEEAENVYLPGNNKKYKISSKKPETLVDEDYIYNDFDDMFNNLDNDDFEQLLSYYKENMNNVLNQLFNGIYSFDIKEIIDSYTKNQLIRLADGLNLSIPQKLKKKDFAEKLFDEYEKAAQSVISNLDKYRYKLLSEGMKKKGIVRSKEDRLEFEISMYNLGLIFPTNDNGMRLFTIPKVVQDIITKNDTMNFRRKIKENTEMVQIVSGMLYTYGVVGCSEIENTLREMGYGFENIVEVLRIFETNKRVALPLDYIVTDANKCQDFLVNGNIEDYKAIIDLTDENTPIQKYSKEKLMMMGKDDYLQHSLLGKNFKDDLLTLFCMSKEDAEEYTDMMALDVQYRSPEEITENVLNGIDAELENYEQRMVSNVMNKFLKNIPLWRLKGFTINEIEKREEKLKEKNNGNNNVIRLF